MVRFCWNLKDNIFICLPIIIDVEIYKWRSPFSLPKPPIPLKKVKFFIYGAILLKFETEHFYMNTNNNLDLNLEKGFPLPP